MSRLTPKERADRRASFQKMNLADKAGYIFEYYKLPIIVGLTALYLVGSTVYRQVTKKDIVLYSAYINVSAGEDLEAQLNEGFLSACGVDLRKNEVYLYSGLYLSDDPSFENHQYQYASRMKLMAAIEAKQLDVMLMNREAYDIYSHKGWLLDLNELLSSDEALYPLVEPYLTTNKIILEDNAIEYTLNEATRYYEITEEAVNGLDVSQFPMFQQAGFGEPVYLGVMGNSPRIPAAVEYIAYLAVG